MRDEALPHAYRFHALGSCVQLTSPIGFNATWSYLESTLCVSQRSIEFLLPAVELLEAQREAHRELADAYVALRRRQKASGLRFPPRDSATPCNPMRWHGDERAGATHVLAVWRGRNHDTELQAHPRGSSVLAAIDEAIRAPGSAVFDPEDLQQVLVWSRRQLHVVGWKIDRAEYQVATVVHRLLGQLFLIANPPPVDGQPWNFVTGLDDTSGSTGDLGGAR